MLLFILKLLSLGAAVLVNGMDYSFKPDYSMRYILIVKFDFKSFSNHLFHQSENLESVYTCYLTKPTFFGDYRCSPDRSKAEVFRLDENHYFSEPYKSFKKKLYALMTARPKSRFKVLFIGKGSNIKLSFTRANFLYYSQDPQYDYVQRAKLYFEKTQLTDERIQKLNLNPHYTILPYFTAFKGNNEIFSHNSGYTFLSSSFLNSSPLNKKSSIPMLFYMDSDIMLKKKLNKISFGPKDEVPVKVNFFLQYI